MDTIVDKLGWSSERLARAIVKGMRKNKPLLPLTPMTWFGYLTKRIEPSLVYWIQKTVANLSARYKAEKS